MFMLTSRSNTPKVKKMFKKEFNFGNRLSSFIKHITETINFQNEALVNFDSPVIIVIVGLSLTS